MKKYCIIVLLFLFASCDLIFHEPNNPFLNIDTEQEKIDMLNGLYSRLVKVHNEDYFAVLSRSDDVNYYDETNNPLDYSKITGNIYLNLYTAIINCNRMLTVVSENNEPTMAGEVYFLRAYAYLKLARLFGTPPIILDTEVNYMVEKPAYADVYKQIEDDMLNAIDLLPETYTTARIPGETPHAGTAKALLSEVYLSMAGYPVNDKSKYAEAARLSKQVIDNSDFYNYKLLDDFAELWVEDNTHTTENIFGLFFSEEPEDIQNSILQVYGGHASNMHYMVTKSRYHPEVKFFDDYPNNYRKFKSFVIGTYPYLKFESIDTLLEEGQYFRPFYPITQEIEHAGCLKWISGFLIFDDNDRSLINYPPDKSKQTLYLLRYAQTLLTYAEAKARIGELDVSALEAVNQIRRRANNLNLYEPSVFDLPASLTSEQFIDSVVWERAWELAMEPDTRWFDVIRLNLKDALEANRYIADRHTKVAENFLTDDWYFFKIPQEDRWNNPNFE